MACSIVSGIKSTIGDDLSFEILRYDEHCRPSDQVIKVELSGIIFGERVKVAKIQFAYVGRGCLAN